MNTLSVVKRFFIFLFDYLLCAGIGFSILCFIPINHFLNAHAYVFLSLLTGGFVYFVYVMSVVYLTNGFTFFSLLFGGRYVMVNEKHLRFNRCFLRAFFESLLVFPIVDLFFLIFHKSERGVIDRTCDMFMISTIYY